MLGRGTCPRRRDYSKDSGTSPSSPTCHCDELTAFLRLRSFERRTLWTVSALKKLAPATGASPMAGAFDEQPMPSQSTHGVFDDVTQAERAGHSDQTRRLQPDRAFLAVQRKRNVITLGVSVCQHRSSDE